MNNSVRRRLTRQISKKGLPAMYAYLDRSCSAWLDGLIAKHLRNAPSPIYIPSKGSSFISSPHAFADMVTRRFQSPKS